MPEELRCYECVLCSCPSDCALVCNWGVPEPGIRPHGTCHEGDCRPEMDDDEDWGVLA
jgi:hypothetical protein